MRRAVAVVSVVLLAAAAGWGTAVWLKGRKPPVQESPAPAETERVAAPPPEAVVEAVGATSVSGLVLGENRVPLSGLTVVCGDESRMTGVDGEFQFPSRRREWPLAVALRKDADELLRWEGVGRSPSEGGGAPSEIHWTLNAYGDGLRPPRPEKSASVAEKTKENATPTIARIRGVFVEERGMAASLRVAGSTPLPNGAHLSAALYFDGDRVISSTESGEARDGRFDVRIASPEDFRLHAATYRLVVTFGLGVEDFQDIERWRVERPDFPWDRAEDLSAETDVFVGDPDEDLRENREIESYFRRTLDDVRNLRALVASRAREARTMARNWDPALAAARRSVQEGARRDGSLQLPSLDAAGKVDLDAWRQFLDESWRPEVLRRVEGQRGRLGGKFRKKEHVLEGLLERLIALSKMESVLVYQALGLPSHPSDFFFDAEMPEGDLRILEQIMDKDMALLEGMCSLVEGQAGARRSPTEPRPAPKKIR